MIDEKMRNARALKSHHRFGFEVAVDGIDGTVHRAFGTRPSSTYIIDPSGTIVFRAHWSNRPEPLEEALRAVVAGRAPSPTNVGQTTRALTRMTAQRMITLSGLFRSLPSERRVAPTVAITLAFGAAAASAGLLVLP
jgi:hypothetical protein